MCFLKVYREDSYVFENSTQQLAWAQLPPAIREIRENEHTRTPGPEERRKSSLEGDILSPFLLKQTNEQTRILRSYPL